MAEPQGYGPGHTLWKPRDYHLGPGAAATVTTGAHDMHGNEIPIPLGTLTVTGADDMASEEEYDERRRLLCDMASRIYTSMHDGQAYDHGVHFAVMVAGRILVHVEAHLEAEGEADEEDADEGDQQGETPADPT